jgi:ketosteroid isomerase-like protein
VLTAILAVVAVSLVVVVAGRWRHRDSEPDGPAAEGGPGANPRESSSPTTTVAPVDPVTVEFIDAQEERFSRAFAAGDISQARDLYYPDVVYLSPTVRLFDWPPVIEGIDATLEFIQLTIQNCRNISYRLDERAILPGGAAAYTRIHFDWDTEDARQRSVYVVLYRYREGLIGQQELYYDPSGQLERLGEPSS